MIQVDGTLPSAEEKQQEADQQQQQQQTQLTTSRRLSHSRRSILRKSLSSGSFSNTSSTTSSCFQCRVSSMKLFDRDEQQLQLVNAYRRLQQQQRQPPFRSATVGNNNNGTVRPAQQQLHSKSEMVLITGPSGTGKTILAKQTLAGIVAGSDHFIHGKCDQRRTLQQPYAPFRAAFKQLVREAMMPGNQPRADDLRHALTEATGGEELVLIDMIPAFGKLFFGSSNRSMDDVSQRNTANAGAAATGGGMSSSSSQRLSNHSIQSFLKFLRLFCTSQNEPLVLLLDDVQWMDTYSLYLLQELLTTSSSSTSSSSNVIEDGGPIPNLMVVTTCRGNEVSFDDPLAVMLRELEAHGVHITEIKVNNLGAEAVTALVADTLQVRPEDCERLAAIAYGMTEGHALYTVQVLKMLQNRGDAPATGAATTTTTTTARMDLSGSITTTTTTHATPVEDTNHSKIAAFQQVSAKLLQSPRTNDTLLSIKLASIGRYDSEIVLQALRIASCLGDTFLVSHVQMVAAASSPGFSPLAIEQALADVARAGILAARAEEDMTTDGYLDDVIDDENDVGHDDDEDSQKKINNNSGHSRGSTGRSRTSSRGEGDQDAPRSYRWTHDSYLSAAYALIPEETRKEFHTELGRILLGELDGAVLEAFAFIILHQFSIGTELLRDQGERMALAQVCLLAGVKSALSSAFEVALTHLTFGVELICTNPRHWEDNYRLSLDLYNGVAEMNYITGRLDKVDECVQEILTNATSLGDKMRAYESQIFALGARQRFREAIDLSFHVLEALKDPLPRNASFVRIGIEFLWTKRMIRDLTTDEVMDLPRLTDPRMNAIMRIMFYMFSTVQRSRPEYAPIIAARAVRKTLKYGVSPISAAGFMALGFMICFPLGAVDEGVRHCRTAMTIIEEFHADDLRCRGMLCLHGFALPWKLPLRTCMPRVMEAAQAGHLSGDLEMTSLSLFLHSCFGLFSGMPLPSVLDDMKIRHKKLAGNKVDTLLSYSSAILQLTYNLTIPSTRINPLKLTGKAMNEEEALDENIESGHEAGVAVILTCKLYLALYLNEIELAYSMAIKLRRMNLDSFNAALMYQVHFLDGMTEVLAARGGFAKCRRARAGKRALKALRKYAEHAPANVLNKILLIEAERCFMKQQYEKAMRKYCASYDCADEQGNLPEQALARERTALLLAKRGEGFDALRYLHKARELYTKWGSPVKINQLNSMALQHKIGDLQNSFKGKLSSEWL